jgi:hypothetical protein
MTEAEWLTCEEPGPMLVYLEAEEGSNRKVRLFACACVRRLWSAAKDCEGQETQSAVLLAEAFIEGKRALRDMREKYRNQLGAGEYSLFSVAYYAGYATLVDGATEAAFTASRYAADGFGLVARLTSPNSPEEQVAAFQMGRNAEQVAQGALLREIFGSPFRSVAFDPAWRTSTAVTLARTMYEGREFFAMPILADALQDAGCDNEDMLSHCRGSGPHVRGCWVVDLVLGKE